MSRDGEILNTSLLRKLATLLKQGAVKQFPKQLNLDDVKVVVSLGDVSTINGSATPGNGQGTWEDHLLTPTIVGSADVVTDILSAGIGIADGFTAFRMDAIHAQLSFNAAGGLAFNGKRIRLQLMFHYLTGDPGYVPIITLNPWVQITSTELDYYWSLGGGQGRTNPEFFHVHTWNGRVPAVTGQFGNGPIGLALRVTSIDGTVFPAATVLTLNYAWRSSLNGIVPVN